MIKIIAIGKKHDDWVVVGIERYQKRLKKPFDFEWVYLKHSTQSGLVAREKESQDILSRVNANDYLVLLDERGKNLDSGGLSAVLSEQNNHSRQIVIVIGGAYGVSRELTDRADLIWSLSRLVFPHQMVRLILTEQIYRAQEIASGNPYHHE